MATAGPAGGGGGRPGGRRGGAAQDARRGCRARGAACTPPPQGGEAQSGRSDPVLSTVRGPPFAAFANTGQIAEPDPKIRSRAILTAVDRYMNQMPISHARERSKLSHRRPLARTRGQAMVEFAIE